MKELESAGEVLSRMLCGYWVSQAIYVAGELGVADELADGPLTACELARRIGAATDGLYRALRALGSVGIISEDADARFSLTAVGEYLRSDRGESQRAFARMMGSEFYVAWGELLYSVRTGKPGFDRHYGQSFFDYMSQHPDRHALYDEAMNGIHGPETGAMLDAYDFSMCRRVVDIGGGNGLTLVAVAERCEAVEGVLFDLPPVAQRAASIISQRGLADRCRVVEGDFFKSVPAGGGTYLLRHVIHDWQDEDAVMILRNCRQAMDSDAKILVIENVISPGNKPCFGKWLDLMMLLVGGRERTAEQYERLFSRADLRLERITGTAAEVSIIEAVPV